MTISEEWIKKTIAELEKDLAAALRFLDFCRRHGLLKKKQNPNRTKWRGRDKMVEYGSVKLAVMKAVDLCPEEWDIDDVQLKMCEIGSPLKKKSISRWIYYMHEMGEIVRVKDGSGPSPAVYKKHPSKVSSEPNPTNTASPTPRTPARTNTTGES